ncbi:MAG TPA: hypothetical protein DDY77_03245 [Clostridiales bacterium]|nr:hypothetical protein [Clostridiales bacterium]
MEILKFALLALVFAVVTVTLNSFNKEFALYSLIAGGVILTFAAVELIGGAFGIFSNLLSGLPLPDDSLKIIIKVVAICYVAEFSTGLLIDFGMKSLADKLSLITKIIILVTAYPLAAKFLELMRSLV